MAQLPKTYERFREEFPQLAGAYDSLGAAAHQQGPLDLKTRELVKLGLAIGGRQERRSVSVRRWRLMIGRGAERGVRKAADLKTEIRATGGEAGASREEVLHVSRWR